MHKSRKWNAIYFPESERIGRPASCVLPVLMYRISRNFRRKEINEQRNEKKSKRETKYLTNRGRH